MENAKVKLIDPESKSISAALGITEERKEELNSLIEAEFELGLEQAKKSKGVQITDQLERLTMYSLHINETAYLCLKLGLALGEMKMLQQTGPMGILGMLFSGKDKRGDAEED